jgi:hypothetical protein
MRAEQHLDLAAWGSKAFRRLQANLQQHSAQRGPRSKQLANLGQSPKAIENRGDV